MCSLLLLPTHLAPSQYLLLGLQVLTQSSPATDPAPALHCPRSPCSMPGHSGFDDHILIKTPSGCLLPTLSPHLTQCLAPAQPMKEKNQQEALRCCWLSFHHMALYSFSCFDHCTWLISPKSLPRGRITIRWLVRDGCLLQGPHTFLPLEPQTSH